MRRIVTGHDAQGKSVFIADGEAPNRITLDGRPGWELNTLWSTKGTPGVPASGDPSLHLDTYLPATPGTRFIFATWPGRQDQARNADPETLRAEYNAKVPGMGHAHEKDNHGMHTTDTVDYVVILTGEVWLELDDGKEVLVKAGDCVVQNGTRHRWHNRSDTPCTMAAVMLGAERRS
ncbi:MAG: cupin domain-containing protein [Proteobacteria bacterium]|nr:cupin domain-containing protein [Pseudomonadota bacterium]